MTPIVDIPGIAQAIQQFSALHSQHLPTTVSAPLQGDPQTLFIAAANPSRSMVDMVNDVAEILYAFHGAITDADAKAAAMTLCAQTAVFPGFQGWAPLITQNNRGAKISWAMQRDLGETAPAGTAWPTSDQDPDILETYKVSPPLTPYGA